MTETNETHVALIAKERIEHGIEVVKTDRKGAERTEVQILVVLPGEMFLVDEAEADRLVAAGVAVAEDAADGEPSELDEDAVDEEDETPPPPAPKTAKATKASKPAPASDNPSLVS